MFLVNSAIAICAVAASQAQAVTFVLNDIGGVGAGTRARAGYETAARYWSSLLTDDVTVNLNVGFYELDSGALAEASSSYAYISMNQGYAALTADRTSTLDTQAVGSLRPLGSNGAIEAVANNFANGANGWNGYTDLSTRLDNDGSRNNSSLKITTASAKALGITTHFDGNEINFGSDGTIVFNSGYPFDFNSTDGIPPRSFDFIGVAIHEIGHALGFVSGVDDVDLRTSPGQTEWWWLNDVENSINMSQLDLFRYGSAGNLDWSTQNTPYFSLDGGVSQLFGDSRFATGAYNGDGRQASHWKDTAGRGPQLGVLDPTSARGQMQDITALDLAAIDAIGWDVNMNVLANSNYRLSTASIYRTFSAVPEPATWGMMILGFGMVGASSRYRRRSSKVAIA
ncbi:NF038122 family metalloprotease [Sphingomonas aliaeris]|uniref:NF038122 family metalloprotease n=1 Tax=Sphingomonas aliaeris TaxID=2759526 RepID=A0A974S6E2_9SPHN|nr:NF038122 family metalloprotease [Sphingomonas aliaeris]